MPQPHVLMVLRDTPQVGGVERAVAQTADALRDEGFRVSALIEPIGAPGDTVAALEHAMPVTRSRIATAGDLIARSDIVHVHAQDCLTWPKSIGWAAKRESRPTVMTIHLPSYPPRGAWSAGRLRVTTTIGAVGFALAVAGTSVFAPSSAAARDARRRLGPWLRVGVLRNGVPDRPVLPQPTGPLRLAFVGRLEPHKEPHDFIDGVAVATSRGADIQADVIGDGELRNDLEARARAAGVGERIRFHGWLSDPERVVAAANLAVLTSYHEGASLVVLEAGAVGRGVIARTGLEGIEEWPGAIYTVPADAAGPEYGAAFVSLASKPATVAALGVGARRAYEAGFTIQRAAESWAASYRTVLARR